MQHEVHFITLKEVNLLLVAARTSAGKTTVTEYAYAMAGNIIGLVLQRKRRFKYWFACVGLLDRELSVASSFDSEHQKSAKH